jgi:type I restriction enzyme M protein
MPTMLGFSTTFTTSLHKEWQELSCPMAVLSTSKKEEKVIREGIIDDDKLDCVIMLPDKLFTNTGISACIWILSNSKTDSVDSEIVQGETLFIDCRGMGTMVNRTLRELTAEDVCKIACTYQTWRSKDFDSINTKMSVDSVRHHY